METLADIAAKLLAETALSAAAPKVGEKLRSMTANAAGGAKGIAESFHQLFAELAGIPEDIQDRLRNQWRKVDAAASSSPMAGLWDSLKSAVSGIVEKTKQIAATIRPATTENTQQNLAAAEPTTKEVTIPQPAENSVRFYHGGMDVDPDGGNKRWLTHDFEYAKGYATKNGNDNPVHYVDIPIDHPRIQDAITSGLAVGFTTLKDQIASYGHFEAEPDISDRLKRYAVPELGYQPGLVQQAVAAQSPPRQWWEDYAKKNDRGEWVATTPEERQQDARGRFAKKEDWSSSVTLPDEWVNPPEQPKNQPSGSRQTSPPVPSGTPSPSGNGPVLTRLFGMLSGLFGSGKAVAGGFMGQIGKTALAAAPRVAATMGGLASPAFGSAAAGLAATGPAGAVVATATAIVIGMAALPKIIKEFGERLADSNRELASYNAEIASSYARFDQAAFFRKLDLANATSGTAGMATNEWTKTLDSLQGPLKALATGFNLWSTGVAVISRNIPMAVQIMTGGLVKADGVAKLVDQIQKDVEKMANGGNGGIDWGDQFTRAFTVQNLPGRNQPKPPVPPIGGGK